MGQHKHNPTAIAAKKGELPPRPKPMGKREAERLITARIQNVLYGGFLAGVKEVLYGRADNG